MMMGLNHVFDWCFLRNIFIKVFFVLFVFNLNPTLGYAEKISFDKAQSLYEEEQYEETFLALNNLLDTNNPEVFNLLGNLYYFGNFVDQDYRAAKNYYQMATKLNFPPAFRNIGLMYENGFFFDSNVTEANKYYLLAHELGDDTATYYLAINYQYGIGVEKDIILAIKYYNHAIELGNESAIIDLAVLYNDDDFGYQNYKKAYELLEPLADQGVADAQYNLGQMYEYGHFFDQDYKTAFDFYYLAHSQDFIPATHAIGILYYDGLLNDNPNYEMAYKYFQKAADWEYESAIFYIAMMWHYGEGLVQDFDKAIDFYLKSASLGYDDSYNGLGVIYSNPLFKSYNIVQARKYFEIAYDNGNYHAPLYLARSYNFYFRYDEKIRERSLLQENIEIDILKSRSWYAKALEMKNYEGLSEYAETYSRLGDLESAKSILLRGLEIARSSNPSDLVMESSIYSLLSGFYDDIGHHEDALRVMKLAIDMVETSDIFDIKHKAMTYRDYAASLSDNGLYDMAMDYYEKSEMVLNNTNEFEAMSHTLNGKGATQESLNLNEDAIESYNSSIQLLGKSTNPINDTFGMFHSNIVAPLIKLNRFDEALIHSEKAVEIFSLERKGHPWHIRAITNLANLHDKLENFDIANNLHLSATKLFTNKYLLNGADSLNYFDYSEYYNNLRTVNSAAEFFYNLYKKTKNFDHLDVAFVDYQKARITSVEFEMARLSDRLNISSNLESKKLKQFQILSDQIDELKLLELESIISSNIKRDEVSNIKSDIESIEIKKNDLDIDGLLTANTMSFNDRIMGIDEVQKKLTDEQLLVFPAETFSDTQVTTFLISNKKVLTVRSEMSAFDLRQAGLNLRSSLQFNGTSGLNDLPEFNFQLSFQIFNELFSSALTEFHSIKDLIVIPTWPISNLPLAVLLSDDPSKTDYGYDKQSWLGLEKNISYLPSVSDLKMLEKSNNTELFASLIGFGDPELGQKNNNLRGIKFVNIEDDELSKSYQLDLLPSLPSTAEELQAIKNIFSDGKSEIYTQENATEDAIKSKDLSNYNVLLFATHGVIADEWEFLDEAALVMTPPKNTNTANNDGLLTTSEIRKLNLNADLVVLSACNTASGNNQSDEGLSGLASAFIFAGAKSIMASHWSVESNTTKQLVTTFFKNLKTSSKMTRSEAMRLSMKKLFSDHRYKHPIFWAPFILVGQS